MGTSSSTLDVGRALCSLLGDTPVTTDSLGLLLGTTLSNSGLERAVPFSTLRIMRHYYTRNFALLLFKCIEVIAQTRACAFESSSTSLSTSSPDNTQFEPQKIQNALRLMRRMLPVAMEDGDTPCAPDQQEAHGPRKGGQSLQEGYPPAAEGNCRNGRTSFASSFVQSFFEGNLACNDDEPEQTLPSLPGQSTTLAKFLGRILVDCCFIHGLTLPKSSVPEKRSESHPLVIESLLWYPGVCGLTGRTTTATTTTTNVNTTIHSIRQELLYTLTAFISYPLFFPPGTRDMVFSEPLLNVDVAPLLPTLVASTLNAILSYVPFGFLPYTSHWVGKEETVVLMSARFLSALLCYPGAPLDASTQAERKPSIEDKGCINMNEREEGALKDRIDPPPTRIVHSARELIRSFTSEEAKYIVMNLKRIIGLKLYSSRTVLPDSQRMFLTQDEFMMLLWRIVEFSPECQMSFGYQPAALDYILPLVDYALNAKRNPKYYSHLQLVTVLLLRLTELRSFCLQCNATFQETIPFEIETFAGSYNDLIIIVLCSFLQMRHDMIRPLHVTCSAIISNLAPFVKSISPVTAEKVSFVFASVSTRCLAYEVSSSSNGVILDATDVATDQIVMFSIVEAVASVLQYHEAAAGPLLSYFMERKELVKEIANLFLKEGHNAFRVHLTFPFLIGTIRDAINAVEGAVTSAASAGMTDTDAVIRNTSLVGVLPTPHRIVVRRLYSTLSMEQWAMTTNWSSLYMHTPPGTFGEQKSIKMLRFA